MSIIDASALPSGSASRQRHITMTGSLMRSRKRCWMYGGGSNCRCDTAPLLLSDQPCVPGGMRRIDICKPSRLAKTHMEQTMKNLLTHTIAASCLVASVSVAQARTVYDGSWDLLFVTQRGACDPTYTFSVNITDGVVTHPNLVRFRGRVARSGAVRASVTVSDKYASGSGRLSSHTGRGTWSGYSGGARCSGYWSARRN